MKNVMNCKSLSFVLIALLVIGAVSSCQNSDKVAPTTSIVDEPGDADFYYPANALIFELRLPFGYEEKGIGERNYVFRCDCDEQVKTICLERLTVWGNSECDPPNFKLQEYIIKEPGRKFPDLDLPDLPWIREWFNERCGSFSELCEEEAFEGIDHLIVLPPDAELFPEMDEAASEQFLENYAHSDFMFTDPVFLYLQFNNREHDFLTGETFTFERSAEFPASLVEGLSLPGGVIPEGFSAPILHIEGDDALLGNEITLIPIPLAVLQ